MKKVKIGVLGGFRGNSMIQYCKSAQNAEIVAICDKNPDVLERQKKNLAGMDIAFYADFDEFIKHDMDGIVLANYAHQHAPFAIKAMRAGKHVFSEVLPCQTMKEAVELVEAVEETGMIYAYGENYCYMRAPYEMKKLYAQNKIGEFEYGECEYIHNTEGGAHVLTYGEPNHWRNNVYSTYYCTHSLGPIIHATGLRPVKVIGIEGTKTERKLRVGSKAGAFGLMLVTLENGGIIKGINGGLYKDSTWYCMYGSKGSMECNRNVHNPIDAHPNDYVQTFDLHVRYDEFSGDYFNPKEEHYSPKLSLDHLANGYGHGGSDFYCMWHFIEKIKGNPEADIIDVYEAMDMALPGMFAFRSILDNSASKDIPNLRNKAERDLWRNDTACTDPEVAGDMLLPTSVGGTPEIDDAVYARLRHLYETHYPAKY